MVMMGYYAVSCLTVQPPLLSQGCAVLNKKVRTGAHCSSAVPGMRLKGRGCHHDAVSGGRNNRQKATLVHGV